MSLIIHLTGCSCSGKSYIQEEFKDDTRVKMWDILDFYHEQKIIVNGEVDWTRYREKAWKLRGVLIDFLESCEDIPVVFIETIGWNETINDILSDYPRVITIALAVPDKEELLRRVQKRPDIKEETVLYFYNRFKSSELFDQTMLLQPYEAGIYIKEWVNGYDMESFQT